MAGAPASSNVCANCGAQLTGSYCASCGQSRNALDRQFAALALEWVDDTFSWDGRFARTLRMLFARPGRVARDYAGGKRASFTPPVRLFLLASVILLAAMATLDMRLLSIRMQGAFYPAGVETGLLAAAEDRHLGMHVWVTAPADDGVASVTLTTALFGASQRSQREPLSEDLVSRITREVEEGRAPHFIIPAMRDPQAVEDAVNAAATQALFLMIAVFMGLNAILHPRRRMIHHAVHSLYFHAALALAVSAWIVVTELLSIPRSVTTFPALAVFALGVIVFERGGYGTSVLGLAWRIPVLLAGYAVGLGLVMLALTVLLIPR